MARSLEHAARDRRHLDAEALGHEQRHDRRAPVGGEFDGGAASVGGLGAQHLERFEAGTRRAAHESGDGGGDIVEPKAFPLGSSHEHMGMERQ